MADDTRPFWRRHATSLVLLALIAIVQFQYWLGDGGRRHVGQLHREVADKQAKIDEQQRTNARLAAEVDDLKRGMEIVEERARGLGMIKPDEVFVQYRSAPAAGAR